MIYVGLGGNLGGEAAVRARFVEARTAFAALGAVRSSGLYRTAPVGPEQPDFLNAVVGIRWPDAHPAAVIATLADLERRLGRDRRGEVRWGPRALDLDALWWDDHAAVRQPDIEVPHPRLLERRFALRPLLDLVRTEALLAAEARVRDQRVELVADIW